MSSIAWQNRAKLLKLVSSLMMNLAERDAFDADPEGMMAKFGLSDTNRDLLYSAANDNRTVIIDVISDVVTNWNDAPVADPPTAAPKEKKGSLLQLLVRLLDDPNAIQQFVRNPYVMFEQYGVPPSGRYAMCTGSGVDKAAVITLVSSEFRDWTVGPFLSQPGDIQCEINDDGSNVMYLWADPEACVRQIYPRDTSQASGVLRAYVRGAGIRPSATFTLRHPATGAETPLFNVVFDVNTFRCSRAGVDVTLDLLTANVAYDVIARNGANEIPTHATFTKKS